MSSSAVAPLRSAFRELAVVNLPGDARARSAAIPIWFVINAQSREARASLQTHELSVISLLLSLPAAVDGITCAAVLVYTHPHICKCAHTYTRTHTWERLAANC